MKILASALLFSAMLLGKAWSQAPAPRTAVDLAKYAGADRERVLYEGAKKEGKLIWYTSLSTYKEMAKFFETKYPGVTIGFYRAPATNLATRIISESQARRYNVDVIETTPGAVMLLRDNKLLMPFHSPHLADYPEGSRKSAGRIVLDRGGSRVLRRRRIQQERHS